MRCPDCDKFVPYGEQDPELNLDVTQHFSDKDVEDAVRLVGDVAKAIGASAGDGVMPVSITGNVRIALTCEQCSTELKEASLELELDVDVPVNPPDGTEWAEDSEWELDGETAENHQRTEGKGGGTKTFYGARVSGNLTRVFTGPEVIGKFDKVAVPFEWYDDIQASSMDELT
jgi:hypothetical protein